jgi:hypothetical protein
MPKRIGLVRCSMYRRCKHPSCGHKTPHRKYRKSRWGDCPRGWCGEVGCMVACTANAPADRPRSGTVGPVVRQEVES